MTIKHLDSTNPLRPVCTVFFYAKRKKSLIFPYICYKLRSLLGMKIEKLSRLALISQNYWDNKKLK